ncbi:MAG: DEAD/DEAH box helicase, partial [Pseudomonadota bacterium]|nr:DEAD/DEAH box helicase [Pseudomonadota bacterium]
MRHESLFFLYSTVTRLKGVGGATAEALERLLPAATTIAGRTVPIIRDLLFHLPIGIVDRRFTCPLKAAPEGVIATFIVTVDTHAPPPAAFRRGGKKPYRVICSNETGDITLVFFNAREDYIKQSLPIGQKRVISGRTEYFDYRLQMTHPDIIAPVEKLAEVQKPEPVYPLTVGITSRRIAGIVAQALEKLPELPEWLADDGGRMTDNGTPPLSSVIHPSTNVYPTWKNALHQAHHPQAAEDLSPLAPARQRLAYDEILANQLHLVMLRRHMQQQPGEIIKGSGALTEALLRQLPFTLTAGQQRVLREIGEDMASGQRMTRLLQGDVGSGKTVVALLAMLRVVEHGAQVAMMAPTELIARQHYETISKFLENLPSPLEGEGAG